MPKPTLLQTLLGRPSQTYSFPAEKQYYSAKDDLVRAATVGDIPSADIQLAYQKIRNTNTTDPEPLYLSPNGPSSGSDQHDPSSDDDDDDVFYTPFSSPPTSMLVDLPLSFFSRDSSPPQSRDDKSSSSSSSSSTTSSHTVVSCSTSPTSDELCAALTALSNVASAPRSDRVSSATKSYTYTDEDWAKEVRWLTQPTGPINPATMRRATVNIAQPAPTPIINLPKSRPRSRTIVARPNTNHRMTALLEEDEDSADDLRASPPPSHPHSNHVTGHSHDIRPTSPASYARTSVSRTVELPQVPTFVSPPPAPGYTTLTLPRASYRPQNPWRTIASGRIDLPGDGRAQHTMVSIEVVRGSASASFLRTGLHRRNSGPRPLKKHDLAGALALTSHTPPPSFVPNSHVLVQVHAVGLEGLDRQIVSDRLGATGFVPGRGVLGR